MADEHISAADTAAGPAPTRRRRWRSRSELPESRLMDRNEQLAAYGVALLAIVASLAIWAPTFGRDHRAIGAAAIGVVIGLLIGVSARTRSRFGTGIVAALGGFGPWAKAPLLGFPFLVLAGWLLMRNSRAVREERGMRRPQRPARGARTGGTARPGRSGRGKRAAEPAAGAGRPAPSKRYTPPKAAGGR